MKSILVVISLLLGVSSLAQNNCESIYAECAKMMNEGGSQKFISDGQVYTAFLDREKAEFSTTFYGGTTYRIVASAGEDENYVIFKITDPDGNILFSNANFKNARKWDFQVPSTVSVKIEAELDPDFKSTGCLVLMIGFQKP